MKNFERYCKDYENYGKHETDVKKGTRWYNDGEINIRAKECPPGFVPGRIKPGVHVGYYRLLI